MRPQRLNPLFRPLASLKGVGKALGPLVARLVGGEKVVDLLWHLPSGLIDRRFRPPIAEAPIGVIATFCVSVEAHDPPAPHSPAPYRVLVRDPSGFMTLVWFRARAETVRALLPEGTTRLVSGRVDSFDGGRQIVHPNPIAPPEEEARVCRVEPVYPLAAGVAAGSLARLMGQALADLPDLPEWLDGPLQAREGWPGWREAVRAVHAPEDARALSPDHPARRRLAFDELLAGQLALMLVRAAQRERPGRALAPTGRLREPALAAVGFALTGAQTRVLAEIDADLAHPSCMLRLLQGDVGSGKTVVALMALLAAIENGAQGALMAPTDLLARQHMESLKGPCAAAGITPVLLTGRDRGRAREAVLAQIADGTASLVIGTHALFQDDVVYHDLALAVIDEQHRFGVQQRLALAAKGRAVDVLVMTATPIPRTLTLTQYGDMDVSRLDEKPPGRVPPDTRVLSLARLDELVAGVGRAVAAGSKVYWVCPLVAESETGDLAAAEARHAHLTEVLGPRIGLVHGRLKPAERDRVMEGFAGTDLDVLVATTVIEVGVNVPTARVMVVEHAERFGLAQLHQLRGRIGRGGGRATCLLAYGAPLGEVARQRLERLRETDDGFLIAEEDLRLRGGGEVLGTRQSGLPGFRLADPVAQGDLLDIARADARRIVETDAGLQGPRAEALRTLLYLFERDAAVRTLRSG
ncbi:ATP-dependent DNA helicase RecG [Pararhodospirillum oryzae]|uniref:ATP-dependent DNA helicase RecG n=1 Tax=Pararhodospirillum oryzae TaxID=478448 RepID=A0A512HBU7_9PROT|nr:ATP-dependent DNA helicase RecG [Pararhodospirillum oryzae]GEO82922.1 ATP-dependent DNA helicase RecG [Pararhodospirillum oryzae]